MPARSLCSSEDNVGICARHRRNRMWCHQASLHSLRRAPRRSRLAAGTTRAGSLNSLTKRLLDPAPVWPELHLSCGASADTLRVTGNRFPGRDIQSANAALRWPMGSERPAIMAAPPKNLRTQPAPLCAGLHESVDKTVHRGAPKIVQPRPAAFLVRQQNMVHAPNVSVGIPETNRNTGPQGRGDDRGRFLPDRLFALGNVCGVWSGTLRSRKPPPSKPPQSSKSRSPIRSSGSTVSAAPLARAAPGIPSITDVSASCTMVRAPAARRSRRASAPSRPIPVRTTATTECAIGTTERNRTSTEGTVEVLAIVLDEPAGRSISGSKHQVMASAGRQVDSALFGPKPALGEPHPRGDLAFRAGARKLARKVSGMLLGDERGRRVRGEGREQSLERVHTAGGTADNGDLACPTVDPGRAGRGRFMFHSRLCANWHLQPR